MAMDGQPHAPKAEVVPLRNCGNKQHWKESKAAWLRRASAKLPDAWFPTRRWGVSYGISGNLTCYTENC